MFLGCAPGLIDVLDRILKFLYLAGPAGTGKTESVKDLAKAMGLLCVVTNCGEGKILFD
jgi:MoxR-like ATPase